MVVQVPRRRKRSTLMKISSLPSLAMKLLDIDFLFSKTRIFLLYGFAPAVIIWGMNTEPAPTSWLELVNILD